MTTSGTAQLSGRFKYSPPASSVDSSSNPTWLSDVIESMACSGRKEEEYTLIADGDVAVSFGSLSSASLVIIKVVPNLGIPPSPGFPNGVLAAPNPVTVKLTSAAGAAAPVPADGFMFLISEDVPFTALSLSRAAGVQTVVRVQLFSLGS